MGLLQFLNKSKGWGSTRTQVHPDITEFGTHHWPLQQGETLIAPGSLQEQCDFEFSVYFSVWAYAKGYNVLN